MKSKDFTTAFTVDQTPEEALAAIQNIRGWWSEGVEGGTEKIGDVFTFRYKDIHRCEQRLTELVPGKKVVWLVVDAYLSFTKDPAEWKGTQLCFEVSRKGKKTEVRFTHIGLTQEHECLGVCSKAWTFYVNDSLRGLIATGKGQPEPRERARPLPASAHPG